MSIFNIKIDKEQLKEKFLSNKSTNIGIIKCYYLLFRKNGLKLNIGSYILLFIILLLITDIFVFLFKGYKSLLKKINLVFKDKTKTINDKNNLETSGGKKDSKNAFSPKKNR